MAKSNVNNKFYLADLTGISIILALPILTFPPLFFPPDWSKAIIFRSVLAILLFLFTYQFLYKKNELTLPDLKKNRIVWFLTGLFLIYLLATIFSADSNFSLWGSPYRGGGFVNFAFYIIFAIFAFLIVKKEDWQKLWDISIATGILVSLVAVIQYFGLFNKIFLPAGGRPASTIGNSILLSTYLLILFLPTLVFALKKISLSRKLFYIISLALFSYVILLTGSRAAWLGLAIGILYFILFYPKKMAVAKGIILILLFAGIFAVYYSNTHTQFPKFLENNKLFIFVESRLSIKLILADPRFYAWKMDLNILKEKPVLGYGPENFSVGFDKFYDPSVPYLSKDWGDWWDRAHNILIQTASDAGILALLIYLGLFISVFWKLNKIKNGEKTLSAHGMQAALIAYFTANFFGFDNYSTYIMFFFLIGYSLYLTGENNETEPQNHSEQEKIWKPALISILFLLLIIFLWQYNFAPLQINAQINKSDNLVAQKNCGQGLASMDKALQNHSILDSYARMEYVEDTILCNKYYPENNLTYVKKGLEIVGQALKIQPLYTRYWLSMGSYENDLALQEKDSTAKNLELEQAKYYLGQALQLSPKHQEIIIEQAKMEMIAGNYNEMKNYSEKCIALNSGLGDCYFYLGLSEIYLKDIANGQKNIKNSNINGFYANTIENLNQLANAYITIPDYQNLANVFEQLIAINPNVAQYHSSLAFFYKELGQYANAKKEALIVLQLSPQSKPNVDNFLKTLP